MGLRDTIAYVWRGRFEDAEVERLHAEGFGHEVSDFGWWETVSAHSLGWVSGRDGERLVGFVNVAWDGGDHAFILDTLVAADVRRLGIGTRLVEVATEQARAAGCEWLHVDFEERLRGFYLGSCAFTATGAGLMSL